MLVVGHLVYIYSSLVETIRIPRAERAGHWRSYVCNDAITSTGWQHNARRFVLILWSVADPEDHARGWRGSGFFLLTFKNIFEYIFMALLRRGGRSPPPLWIRHWLWFKTIIQDGIFAGSVRVTLNCSSTARPTRLRCCICKSLIVPYTNRPFGRQRRYTKCLTLLLMLPRYISCRLINGISTQLSCARWWKATACAFHLSSLANLYA